MSSVTEKDPTIWKQSINALVLLQPILKVAILTVIFLVAFFVRQFSVVRFESIIHEFDPWFNYRATRYFVEHGWDEFINWFDEFAWYPLGRIVGGTVYPGLMLTSGLIHWVLNGLNMTIHIREVCVFLAPLFSGFSAIAAYLLTKELKDEGAGLLAAAFMGIAPGYISRSVAGSYDNEGIAIFALIYTYYCWIKALKLGSMFWGAMTALVYFYMVSAWGGYVFITNLIPLHVLTLLLMGRYTSRVYVSYCTFFGIGHLLSMQIPFVGFLPVKTSEHMAFIGVFGLLQLVAFSYFVRQYIDGVNFIRLIKASTAVIVLIGLGGLILLSSLGYIAPFAGRFYSLWDTGYAKIHIPIIASVSEHQPTPWTSYFTDLSILVPMIPVGVWCCFQNLTNENVFILLYAATSVYFSGVMVRLMLTLTPCACILAAIAFSSILDTYMRNDTAGGRRLTGEEMKTYQSPALIVRTLVVATCTYMFIFFSQHCTHTTSTSYSSPSVVLALGNNILDDFRESYYWLRQNTEPDANIMSWWDYGYQIGGFSNRSTLVDNNTWNNTHIAMVGKTMASNETEAFKLLEYMDVDYVLVIFGGYIGYSGDDINKFLWMVRIAEGEFPDKIQEKNYFSDQGHYKIDASASDTMKNCLMYKMCYHRFGELGGMDRVRNTPVGNTDIQFEHLDEAYTSEHWMVRIYKVRKSTNRDSPAPKMIAKPRSGKKRGMNA
eukprot:CFRG8257T1